MSKQLAQCLRKQLCRKRMFLSLDINAAAHLSLIELTIYHYSTDSLDAEPNARSMLHQQSCY